MNKSVFLVTRVQCVYVAPRVGPKTKGYWKSSAGNEGPGPVDTSGSRLGSVAPENGVKGETHCPWDGVES